RSRGMLRKCATCARCCESASTRFTATGPNAWSRPSPLGPASTTASGGTSHEFDARERPYSEEDASDDLTFGDEAEHPRVLGVAAGVAHHPVGLGRHPLVVD